MGAKLLEEAAWKAVAQKFKVDGKELQQALAAYGALGEDEFESKLKSLAKISAIANNLKRAKTVAPLREVTKYLADLTAAAEAEKNTVNKAKVQAVKTAAAQKAKEVEKDGGEADEEDQEEGQYAELLKKALQRLKGAKGVEFPFIVCDAKPVCAVMVAKQISPKHKQELSKVTGGSKRFLKPGTCRFQDGKFHFTMEQPVTGLARKLQESIKNFTGLKLPIVVGAEAAEDDEPAAPAKAAEAAVPATPAAAPARQVQAPEQWHNTRDQIAKSLEELKSAVKKEFASEAPEVVAEVEKNMKKVDGILEKLDHKLADSFKKASSAATPAARQAELKNAKGILVNYLNYVKSEPLIAHVDANPFGVKTNLKQTLAAAFAQMAKAIS